MNARLLALLSFLISFVVIAHSYPYYDVPSSLEQPLKKRFRGEPIRFGKRAPREPIRFGKRASLGELADEEFVLN